LQKKEKQILSLTKVHQKFDNKSLNDQNWFIFFSLLL
jgi:hypothetical protein